MSHTPGPWYSHLYLSVACENDGEYGSATCITNTPEDEYAATGNSGDWVAFIPHDGNHAANARLIAAAPDLLAVARMAFDYAQDTKARFTEHFDFDDEESYDNLCDACEKAISKAEGGE